MMTMVERVAAIIRDHRLDLAWSPERMARAAIEAMREPTQAMVTRGDLFIFEDHASAEDWALAAIKEGWQEMIDEALR